MRLATVIGVLLGVLFDCLGLYLMLVLGFIGVGVGLSITLLFGHVLLKRFQASNQETLTIILATFRGSSAASFTISLVFTIWLATNYSIEFPSWLMPPLHVLMERNVFHQAWLIPLAVRYFLMIVPGMLGLIWGWGLRDRLIEEEKLDFPNQLQTAKLIQSVTTGGQQAKTLSKMILLGLVVTAIIELSGFNVLDFSNTGVGWLIGMQIGALGLVMAAAGYVVGPKLSGSLCISSILFWTLLSPFIVGGAPGLGYYDFFSMAMSGEYLSIGLGLIIMGVVLFPMIKGRKKKSEGGETDQKRKGLWTRIKKIFASFSFIFRNSRIAFAYFGFIIICVCFVLFFGVLGSVNSLMAVATTLVVLVVGGSIQMIIILRMFGATGVASGLPLVFYEVPIFLTGYSGYTAYCSMPSVEADSGIGIVACSKVARMTKTDEKALLKAFIVGNLSAIAVTPIFGLLLWRTYGIGTAALPTPAFPALGALISVFATRSIGGILSLPFVGMGLLIGLLVSFTPFLNAMGFAIGIFLPPHFAICFLAGGLVRWWTERRKGKEYFQEKGLNVSTGLSTGASFTILILIIIALISGRMF